MRICQLVAFSAAALAGCGAEHGKLLVSAAASLQKPLEEIARSYEQTHLGAAVAFNFAASGMLAQQIEQGAPVDVFLSAAPQPMDRLEALRLILPGTRRNLLSNRIVLIVPKNAQKPKGFSELTDPAVKLLAIGDPGTVPAGDYGRAALQALGLWESVKSKLIFAKDVRQVLTYVETGNAEAGIAYSTDAARSEKVKAVAVAPASSHPPVVYPAAVLQRTKRPAAALAFLAYLSSPPARTVFEREGFLVVAP